MSHSQFHSTNLFILRHAWLNLWDKHMTTGRINQVTTFPICPPFGKGTKRPILMTSLSVTFLDRSSSTKPTRLLKSQLQKGFKVFHHLLPTCLMPMTKSPFPPVSQVSDTLLLVTRGTKIMVFKENYQQPAAFTMKCFTVMADSQMVNCKQGLAIGK